MKRAIISMVLMLTASATFGQLFLNVLFVNDNKVNSSNTNLVLSNLAAIGVNPDVFNAVDSLRSPTFDELSQYNFVIWYCSSDGVGLQLWNGNDTDNEELKTWLDVYDNSGFWLMGTDMLYDRWTTPSTFQSGDFVYDYLGLQEYHAQAYGDDGGLGVPQLDVVEFSPFVFTPIMWQFPTAWWVDACLPAPDAIAAYSMGPQGYALDSYYAAILNFQGNNNPRMTYFFDPALMDSDANMQALFEEVFWYITNLITDIDEPASAGQAVLTLAPNPATNIVRINLASHVTIRQIAVYNTSGKAVLITETAAAEINVAQLPSGLYMLAVETENGTVAERFIKQ